MRQRIIFAAMILSAILVACPANARLVEEVLAIPVEVLDAQGKSVRQPITVFVFRDDAKTRSPFLVLNHGRSSESEKRLGVSAAQFAANARYFVERGFAVFVPIRVGYGATGGPDVENSGPCRARRYAPVYAAGAAQTAEVIRHAKSLPYIDPSNGLVVGQSFGGTIAIAIAAKGIEGVKAAINFAGGGGGRPKSHPGEPCSVDRMTALFASYGATARIPTLWLYSENDQYWGAAVPRTWFKAFADRGGVGQFVQLPPYKSDGHPSFTGNPGAWRPAIEPILVPGILGDPAPTPQPASPAALNDTPQAFTQVLAAWAAKHQVKGAIIIVRRNGRVIHEGAVGGADPSRAVLLASLSKAITGACVATLVRDGKLGFETMLAQALAKFFKVHGRPTDRRIERVTVAQLLTHRAGFSSATDGEDPATRFVLQTYLKDHSSRAAPKAAYLTLLFQQRLLRDPGKQFAYSNAGYMALGAVVEEATGRSYEDSCRDAVLKPAGAAGALDPQWGVLWSAGGWRMTGADYLAFYEQFDLTRSALGIATRNWMLDGTRRTIGQSNSRNWYGLGTRMRAQRDGTVVWHTGSWRRKMAPDVQGPRSAETSTLAVRVADGTSWFVHSLPLVLDGARNELDRELMRAYRSVRHWK